MDIKPYEIRSLEQVVRERVEELTYGISSAASFAMDDLDDDGSRKAIVTYIDELFDLIGVERHSEPTEPFALSIDFASETFSKNKTNNLREAMDYFMENAAYLEISYGNTGVEPYWEIDGEEVASIGDDGQFYSTDLLQALVRAELAVFCGNLASYIRNGLEVVVAKGFGKEVVVKGHIHDEVMLLAYFYLHNLIAESLFAELSGRSEELLSVLDSEPVSGLN